MIFGFTMEKAGWSRGGSPRDKFDYCIVFFQYLAVIHSLLIGKVKIVKSKINTIASNSIFHRKNLPLQKILYLSLCHSLKIDQIIYGKKKLNQLYRG